MTNFFLILASLRVISPGHSGGEAGKEEGLATMSLEFELYLRFPCGSSSTLQKKNKTKTVVSLATFVALQVWYGITNERVPKSPLK